MARHLIRYVHHYIQDFSDVPMNTATGFWWIIFGILSLNEGFRKPFTESAIALFPNWVAIFVGNVWVYGGLILLWSLYTNNQRLEMIYQWRKGAYTLGILAGIAYAYQTASIVPLDYMATAFGLFNLTLGLFGLLSVIITEEKKRRDMRKKGHRV